MAPESGAWQVARRGRDGRVRALEQAAQRAAGAAHTCSRAPPTPAPTRECRQVSLDFGCGQKVLAVLQYLGTNCGRAAGPGRGTLALTASQDASACAGRHSIGTCAAMPPVDPSPRPASRARPHTFSRLAARGLARRLGCLVDAEPCVKELAVLWAQARAGRGVPGEQGAGAARLPAAASTGCADKGRKGQRRHQPPTPTLPPPLPSAAALS